jgi:hypothetical protein
MLIHVQITTLWLQKKTRTKKKKTSSEQYEQIKDV